LSWIHVSHAASARISELARARECSEHAVRIYAERDGCGAAQFGMSFDSATREDRVESISGCTFVIDPESAAVAGTFTIDYAEEEGRPSFRFTQASHEVEPCGCSL